MARARPVAGEPIVSTDVQEVRAEVLDMPQDAAKVRAEVAEMRKRIASAKASALLSMDFSRSSSSTRTHAWFISMDSSGRNCSGSLSSSFGPNHFRGGAM